MATEDDAALRTMLAGLAADHWSDTLEAIARALEWSRAADPGDERVTQIISALVNLALHEKWEVRRAIAQAAASMPHTYFEPVLARLALDPNARVREAAHRAAARRVDGRHASVFGKQHEDRINATLDGIEARYGLPGREAVKRAAESIANTFARELYHEVIRLMSPLATAADRLQSKLKVPTVAPEALVAEAARIGQHVRRLEAVLNGMRSYTAAPPLQFAPEPLHEIIDEAAQLARGEEANVPKPSIEISVPHDVACEVARPRMVQALTNLLANAIESYEGATAVSKPIQVYALVSSGSVTLTIQDYGVGMSPEVLRDAPTLFATNKPNGTGFGLPLAIKIIEVEHGGRMKMESHDGAGTAIHIVLQTRRGEPK